MNAKTFLTNDIISGVDPDIILDFREDYKEYLNRMQCRFFDDILIPHIIKEFKALGICLHRNDISRNVLDKPKEFKLEAYTHKQYVHSTISPIVSIGFDDYNDFRVSCLILSKSLNGNFNDIRVNPIKSMKTLDLSVIMDTENICSDKYTLFYCYSISPLLHIMDFIDNSFKMRNVD